MWRNFGDPKKAEMSFRKMKGPAPDKELLKEFRELEQKDAGATSG